MQQTVYIDTSVVGGVFDDEFKDWTRRFFRQAVNLKHGYKSIEIRTPREILK